MPNYIGPSWFNVTMYNKSWSFSLIFLKIEHGKLDLFLITVINVDDAHVPSNQKVTHVVG